MATGKSNKLTLDDQVAGQIGKYLVSAMLGTKELVNIIEKM